MRLNIYPCFTCDSWHLLLDTVAGSTGRFHRSFMIKIQFLSHTRSSSAVLRIWITLYITSARDASNRLFIVERPGRIKVLLPGATAPMLFLDITEKVSAEGEGGLLGLAFHPGHNNNRRFFICYSRVSDEATVVAEYRVSKSNSNSVKKMKERLILVIPQPSEIHHGGMIEFGPDNFLYISTGDGDWEDPGNSAQDTEDLRGKILRIDVDHTDGERAYVFTLSNPFSGATPAEMKSTRLAFVIPGGWVRPAVRRAHVGDWGMSSEKKSISSPRWQLWLARFRRQRAARTSNP